MPYGYGNSGGSAVTSVAGKTGAVTLVQGDVANLTVDLAAKLVKTSNLSDLANAATARTNLGLGTMATQAASAYLNLSSPGPLTATMDCGDQILSNVGRIFSDEGTFSTDGEGRVYATSFAAMEGPSFLGPAGFASDGGNISSDGFGNLTVNGLQSISGGLVYAPSVEYLYAPHVGNNGDFNGGAATVFHGDGSYLSGYTISLWVASADWANSCGHASIADSSTNADHAGSADNAGNSGRLYFNNGNFLTDAWNNVFLPALSGDPNTAENPVPGWIYFNTTLNRIRVFDGAAWHIVAYE